ncbi:hypothetical protein U9M48_034086 [Paspalum notatum var. saurae]|uniref:At1g61320/AtMIF1 LRR domain-containing protein n=1 Tax=Paspalum notatum var. saurae TaxID=547442 RepID=A0AAQ3U8Y8_PASNO
MSTKLHLNAVRITGDELGCLISKYFALEQLELWSCRELICLKIPFWLERLSCLLVSLCKMLQVIESTAPNLSSFTLFGDPVQLSLGESSQVKKLHMCFSRRDNLVSYSITRLPSIVPHLETLIIDSNRETIETPMAANRSIPPPHVNHVDEMLHVSVYGDVSHMRQIMEASEARGGADQRLLLCKEHG